MKLGAKEASMRSLAHALFGAVLMIGLIGCIGLRSERVLYHEHGIRIGLQADRSIARTPNSHPKDLTGEQVNRLLSLVRVTGYSGTIAGLVAVPKPIPVFSEEELELITSPIAEAFAQAGPQERVFFSLPNLKARYERDRTEGALFFRGPYLFLLLTDHSTFIRTDTGGSDDDRDPRDTKGMRLWVARPARVASIPSEEMPKWGPFEKVSIAFNADEALSALAALSSPPRATVPGTDPTRPSPEKSASMEMLEDLRLKIRELTSANQDLRKRLAEQAEEMKSLKEELNRVRREFDTAPPRAIPRRNAPSP